MPQTTDGSRARELLRAYGYLGSDAGMSSTEDGSADSIGEAVAAYQRRHRLHVTGVLDDETRAHLSVSRCSWLDRPPLGPTALGGAVLIDAANEMGGAALAAVSLPWFLQQGALPSPAVPVDQMVTQAFQMWEAVTPVVFPRQAQPHLARLLVGFAHIDGARGTIGRTGQGARVLDSGEQWSITLPPLDQGTADVLTIALHEIGHALGIGDNQSDASAVMHGFFDSSGVVIRRAFVASDFQAIADRFGT